MMFSVKIDNFETLLKIVPLNYVAEISIRIALKGKKKEKNNNNNIILAIYRVDRP